MIYVIIYKTKTSTMESKKNIGTIVIGAAAAWALYSYLKMPKQERQDLVERIKTKASHLLEDADTTVEKVQHYVAQIQNTHPNEWFDKLYLLRKMLREFFGQEGTKQLSLQPSAPTRQ